MSDEDYVRYGSMPGWYRHPTRPLDYYYTGRGFGTVDGQYLSRPYRAQGPDFEPMDEVGVAEWVRMHGPGSDIPLTHLIESAVGLGGNAIVGVNASTFGAHGGLTSGFGGDAVGVLLTGTVVRVVKEPSATGS